MSREDFFVGFLTFASMFCSNFALKFVNYPLVVLSKSAKIMPVIIIGALRKVHTVHPEQYVMAALITTGLVLFNSKKMDDLELDNAVGIALIIGSLIFDGLVSSQTDKEHKKSGRDFAYSMMFSNNFVQLLFNLMFYGFYFFVHGDDTLAHLFSEPALLRDVVLIGAAGALGQIFLYLAISLFGSYKLSVITTSRKLFSVILSNFSFHHHFTSRQWLGAALVMACTIAELFFGKKEKKEPETTAEPIDGSKKN